ncbi:MAG: c-type cytochrome [Chitinophagaceae bacterium]|nr:c-type cytochrome [Chitinophagaceae bacterium]
MTNKKIITTFLLIIAVIIVIIYSPSCQNSAEKTIDNTGSFTNNSQDSFKARPLTNITFTSTPERLSRGEYLVNGILHCLTCHSPLNWNAAGAPPVAGKEGSGGDILFEDSTTKIIAPNITPDKETGAGMWTDDMLVRAIREGIGHDGRALSTKMPYYNFRYLSDEDLAAVIVYLRSLPAVYNKVAATKLSADEKSWLEKSYSPVTEKVIAPDLSDSIQRGSYLVRIGDCMGCHSYSGEYSPGLFAGGYNINISGHQAFSANITTDASGINYGLQAFFFVIRTGKGNTLSPVMPWNSFKNLNDADLRAIYAYLTTLPKAQHYITNQQPFTYCILCGQKHGNGDKNIIPKPHGIKVSDNLYDKYVGVYFNEKYNATYIITKQGKKLMGQQAENAPKIELIPQTATYFLTPGWPLPVNFISDAAGNITALKEATDYGEVFKKIK